MKYSLVFAPKKIHFRKRRSRFMSASEFIRICSLSTNLSVDCTVCQIENNNIQLAAPIWHDWVRECLTKKMHFFWILSKWFLGYLHDMIDLRLWLLAKLTVYPNRLALSEFCLDEVNQLSIPIEYFEENGIKNGKFLSSARLNIGNRNQNKLTRHLLTQLLIKM